MNIETKRSEKSPENGSYEQLIKLKERELELLKFERTKRVANKTASTKDGTPINYGQSGYNGYNVSAS